MAKRPKQFGSLKGDDRIHGAPVGIFEDLYHFLVTTSWQALIGIIAAAFTLANLLFATGYYFDQGIENAHSGSFSDMFFFSVQTMATIGYGKMEPFTLFSNILVSIEALTGLLALALMTGLVFSKFSRPTARVRFSRYVVDWSARRREQPGDQDGQPAREPNRRGGNTRGVRAPGSHRRG